VNHLTQQLHEGAGSPLDGDTIGCPRGGSLVSGLLGVDDDGGVKLVVWEYSPIGTNGDQGSMC